MSQQLKKHSSLKSVLDSFDNNIAPNPLDLSIKDESQKNHFEELLQSAPSIALNLGDIVSGTITEIRGDKVIVDIKYKSEGVIDKKEFLKEEELQVGAKVESVVHAMADDSGLLVLSKEKCDIQKSWSRISKMYETGESIEGRILNKVKGGYDVDIGIKAFLPQSQLDFSLAGSKDDLKGQVLEFKVIKFNKKRGNIVLSRRAILEESREKVQFNREGPLEVGNVVTGFVKNITEYGAFVDLGGVDGLLHVSDMSWSRSVSPKDVVQVGAQLEVKVLKVNSENSRVSLGLKQLKDDPWANVASKYPATSRITCSIAKIIPYGAFVTLEDGIDGFIHVTELSWSRKIDNVEDFLKVDEKIECLVLGYNEENRRVRLSIKKLTDGPWKKLAEDYPPGTVIESKVESVVDFGVFFSISDGISGLVHVSDLSWIKSVKPSDEYKTGDIVNVVVLEVDIEGEKVRLGIKQLEKNPWEEAKIKYTIGNVQKVKVAKVSEFGAFVDLEPGVGGLIHISELSSSRVENVSDVLEVGQEVEAEIISLDFDSRKIGLSLKALKLSEEREVLKQVQGDSSSRLGDVLKGSLDGFVDSKEDTGSSENSPKED